MQLTCDKCGEKREGLTGEFWYAQEKTRSTLDYQDLGSYSLTTSRVSYEILGHEKISLCQQCLAEEYLAEARGCGLFTLVPILIFLGYLAYGIGPALFSEQSVLCVMPAVVLIGVWFRLVGQRYVNARANFKEGKFQEVLETKWQEGIHPFTEEMDQKLLLQKRGSIERSAEFQGKKLKFFTRREYRKLQ
ncbi:MAG: hypothetical protein JXJ20_03690 [Anaerolineae bacterium]|nr:hypothetical protein [Anaerolineae bacterium]